MKKLIYKWQESGLFNYICNKAIKKGKAQSFSDEFYSKLKTEFAGINCGEILKTANTNGKCYFYSLLLAKALEGGTLIVGKLNALNSNIRNEYIDEFGHGWVEKDGLVYDTTSKQIFNKDWYYKKFNAEVKQSYLSEELNNPDLFFKLGINAVKDRSELVKPLFEIIKNDLPIIYSNADNVEKSLSVVYDSLVKKELNKYFSSAMKK